MNVIVVPCLFDNYSYIIENEVIGEAAVVDPSEAWPVMRELEGRGLRLSAVLCTHHHRDHIGGIDDLCDEFDDLEVFGFRGDERRLPRLNRPVDDGDTISVCGFTGSVMHTPGHTTGGVVYCFEDCLFTGDTLFGAGCGRLFEGTAEQMAVSLKRIAACGPEKKLYFGHEYTVTNLRFASQLAPGNEEIRKRLEQTIKKREQGEPSSPSTMFEELQTNPFLRCDDPEILEYLERNAGLPNRDTDEIFARIRLLRNDFS